MINNAVIDISHWNEIESFEDAKAAGVVAIISKATENNNYIDPTYAARKIEAEAVGLLWGAYHFLRPGNMQEQAKYFVDFVGRDLDLYAADHEDAGVTLAQLKQWLHAVEQLTGKKPIIYSGNVLKEQISDPDPELAPYRLWLAQYTSGTPSWPKGTWPKWWLWQWTEHGDCPGVTGDIDVNKYDGSAQQLAHEWTGGISKPSPPKPSKPSKPSKPPAINPPEKSRTIIGGIIGWITGAVGWVAALFEHIDNAYALAAFVLFAIVGTVALWMIVSGRLRIGAIAQQLMNEAGQ